MSNTLYALHVMRNKKAIMIDGNAMGKTYFSRKYKEYQIKMSGEEVNIGIGCQISTIVLSEIWMSRARIRGHEPCPVLYMYCHDLPLVWLIHNIR